MNWNWRRIAAWGTVIVLVLLVGGWRIAVYFDPNDPTRQTAIFSGFLAFCGLVTNLGKIVYDVWAKERELIKKDEEKKEKLKAAALFSPPVDKLLYAATAGMNPDDVCVVGVELFNDGLGRVDTR